MIFEVTTTVADYRTYTVEADDAIQAAEKVRNNTFDDDEEVIATKAIEGTPEPVIGGYVYVPTSIYLTHGRDDFIGGLCRITNVIRKPERSVRNRLFVRVDERPASEYNWLFLMEQQEELREEYGSQRGHADPDYSSESNSW